MKIINCNLCESMLLLNCLVFSVLLNYIACDLSEGESCRITDGGGVGQCRRVQDCPDALDKITRGILPQTCSYVQLVQIVCCKTSQTGSAASLLNSPVSSRPSSTSSARPSRPRPRPRPTNRFGGEKSKEMCNYYGSLIVHEEADVILLPGAPKRNVTDCYIPPSRELVIGGEDAELREFPHMAALGFGPKNKKEWRCGGTLISERFVLTAAHCMALGSLGKVKWVRLGDLNIYSVSDNSDHADYEVIDWFRHQNYRDTSHYDDIGLLKVDKNVRFTTFIRPACLNTEYEISESKTIATGWGLTDNDNFVGSRILQKVALNILDTSICNRTFRGQIGTEKLRFGLKDEAQICIGDLKEDKDTCVGDSGGPAQYVLKRPECMYSIVGITSFGSLLCGGRRPGVYTRVSHYIPWIENIVWPN